MYAELDINARVLEVPPELADVLDADDDARRSFERLTYAEQQRFISGARRRSQADERRPPAA